MSRPALSVCLIAMLAVAGCASGPGVSRATDDGWQTAPATLAPRRIEVLPLATAATSALPVAAATAAGEYRLGIGDIVQLHVVDEPDLTLPGGYPVGADGAIDVPFLGRVPAAEMTTEALRASLAERLRPYHDRPQVFVRISAFNARQVSVVGAVRQPGRHALTDQPLGVIDAINASGGFQDPERTPRVTILRQGGAIEVDIRGFLTEGRALPDLRDGDVVQVTSGNRAGAADARPAVEPGFALHIAGQTRRHPLGNGLTLATVARHAAPLSGDTIYLLRRSTTGMTALSGSPLESLDPAIGGRVTLQDGDLVAILQGPAHDHSLHLSRVLSDLPTE